MRTVVLILLAATSVAVPLSAALGATATTIHAAAPGWTYRFDLDTFGKTATGMACNAQTSSQTYFLRERMDIVDSISTSANSARHIQANTTTWWFEGDFVQQGNEWVAARGNGTDAVHGQEFAATFLPQGTPVPITSLCPMPKVSP